MRYKAGEIRHYNFTAQDKLFLDANIWLYLYGPAISKLRISRSLLRIPISFSWRQNSKRQSQLFRQM